MTEYWKSQARKYCEFCKCWFADNKVSISFHENGKRHKENVQNHISKLGKKSAKEFKQKAKIDDDMKKMEEAAMAAYLKDVQNNADLTSQCINEMLNNSANNSHAVSIKTETLPVWQEVKSDDGNIYYWNKETNETTWDAPDDYVSIAQQEEDKLKEEKAKRKQQKLKEAKEKESIKEAKMEVEAHLAREKMKEIVVKQEKPEYVTTPIDYGPKPRGTPYGNWIPVVDRPPEIINLQLPRPDKKPIIPPVILEPERFNFEEKTVESLGNGPVQFKKRKLNNPKRNMRQKVDDE